MASTEILVGPSITTRVVESTPFIPGLVLHKAPDAPAPHDLYNITHRTSGLAVVVHVPEDRLPSVQRMLMDACWTISPEEIFADPAYHRLIREVLVVVRGEDVLAGRPVANRRRTEADVDWGYFDRVEIPLCLVRTISGITSVVVSREVLSEVEACAERRSRTPVLMVAVQGKEELAVVPYSAFPPKFFHDLRLLARDATIRDAFALTEQMADQAVRGVCWRFSFGPVKYVALGYLSFLNLAKRGLP